MICVLEMPTPPTPPQFIKRDDRQAVQQSTMKLVCRLQDILDAQSMTRHALGEGTGLSSGAIRGLCENTTKRLDRDTVAAICSYLGIDIGDLLTLVPRDKTDE